MDRSILIAVALIAVLVIPATVSAADPDIKSLRAIPSDPLVRTDFEIYVRATDDEGIDRIKFYADGNLEDTQDCDGDTSCSVYFEAYETDSGTHTYKVRVYDTDDNTETDEIDVYVRSRSEDIPDVSAYASPSQPQTGQSFYIYTTATDGDGLRRIEVLHGGSVVGSQDCSDLTTCSRRFTIAPKYTPSTYVFNIKAYGTDDDTATTSLSVVVVSSAPYCGDSVCNGGETCSSCPQDCGACPIVSYCGDAVCNNGETCSSCQQDCGACSVPILPVIYTCGQRGGECCQYGGTGIVDGGADCPSSCFSECNPAPTPPVVEPTTPTGAAIVVDAPVLILAILALMMLLLLYIAAKL